MPSWFCHMLEFLTYIILGGCALLIGVVAYKEYRSKGGRAHQRRR